MVSISNKVIFIRRPCQSQYMFPVLVENENEFVDFKAVKKQFPEAPGIMYRENDVWHILPVINERIWPFKDSFQEDADYFLIAPVAPRGKQFKFNGHYFKLNISSWIFFNN
jgi:hypothetical protein